MTFADGVKSQTAASMIETKLSQHPTRSQVVRPPPSHAPPRLASQSCRRDLSARPAHAALLTAPLVETRTRTRTGWNGQVGLPRDFLAARTDRISRSCRRASSIVSAAAAAAAAARGSPNCCPPPPQACHTAPPCMAPRTSTRVHAVGGSASGEVSDRQTAMHVCVCVLLAMTARTDARRLDLGMRAVSRGYLRRIRIRVCLLTCRVTISYKDGGGDDGADIDGTRNLESSSCGLSPSLSFSPSPLGCGVVAWRSGVRVTTRKFIM
jgi:hypothetical protein